ncbi:Cytidylyltransferase family protein [Entomobacter blattae]|uniref:Phosphatidate cytidylyltransferase n=2 Tax=Entomobacter blattae TaxID=2762277 RepID=A0A7H1NSK8_9PROT|nr:Cytidylyltransferase family protein [Entomobacter blattae]
MRLFSAVIMVIIAGGGIFFGGWVFITLLVMLVFFMMWEWCGLYNISPYSVKGFLGLIWPIIAVLSASFGYWQESFAILAMGWIAGTTLWFGASVIGVSSLSLLWLRVQPLGLQNVLFLVCIVAASDSCAYLGGRLLGGRKLAPAISPAKTVSGALCALGAACMVGIVLCLYVYTLPMTGGGIFLYGVCGGVLGVATQVGDLAESALKRARGVKDSSHMIPGHGGFLDRFDGYLVAAPVGVVLFLLLY